MSSGEAELYAMVKAASQSKYMMRVSPKILGGASMASCLDGLVRTDSTVALGISQRYRLGGRTRHVQVQILWIQEALREKGFNVEKASSENLAGYNNEMRTRGSVQPASDDYQFRFSRGVIKMKDMTFARVSRHSESIME